MMISERGSLKFYWKAYDIVLTQISTTETIVQQQQEQEKKEER